MPKLQFKLRLAFLLTLIISANIAAQPVEYDCQTLSSMPVRLPLSMAGGFAEIRSNHFHSGIDIRTNGKEGERVYAPADGYVSRINISAWGGGKVLYITHPDGYRTVYMHLSAFCGDIGSFVHRYQYSHHLYAFDIEIPPDSLPVKKGQLVALTGNTGGSAGPHLHYEIRYAANDQPINPLYFGLPYSDNIPPTIAGIKVYPADQHSKINGIHNEIRIFPAAKPNKSAKGKRTAIPQSDTVIVNGRFYTGIYTYDQMEAGSSSKNGVEKIELYVDGILFHRYQVSTFLFEETRAINAIIDYPQYRRNREYYIISRHLRGDRNNFSISYDECPSAAGNGCLLFKAGTLHRLEYRVFDHKGNSAKRSFFVRADANQQYSIDSQSLNSIEVQGDNIVYFKRFALHKEGFSLTAEPYTVYENDQVIYTKSSDAAGLSPLHKVTLKRHPLPPHQSFNVMVPVPKAVPSSLHDKLTIVCVSGKDVSACPTTLKGAMLEASSRSFGGFAVRLDTIPPTVKAANFSETKPLTASVIKVKIADNLTGVVSYSCHVNGEWQLAEHDGKTATLSVSASSLRKGTNRVTFTISDGVGNTTKQTWKIIK